jgi:hypothetical protein
VAALVKPGRNWCDGAAAMQAQRWGCILSISSTSVVALITSLALSNPAVPQL